MTSQASSEQDKKNRHENNQATGNSTSEVDTPTRRSLNRGFSYHSADQLILARQSRLLYNFYKLVAALTLTALMLIPFLPSFSTFENAVEPFARNIVVMLTVGVLYYLLYVGQVLRSIVALVCSCAVIASYTVFMESPGNLQMITLLMLPTCFAGFLPRRWQFWMVFVINFALMLLTIWLITHFRAVDLEYRSIVTIGILMALLAIFIDALSSSYRDSVTQTFNQLKEIQSAEAQLQQLDADLDEAVSKRIKAETVSKALAQTGKMALEVAGAGPISINLTSGDTAVSKDFFEQHGFQPVPQTLQQLTNSIHDDDRARFEALLNLPRNSDTRLGGDFQARTAKPVYWMFVLERAVSETQEQVLEGIVVDVTNRVIEQQRRVADELKLQESQRLESLGVLAGAIAHDFNNLLHVIMLNADLARQSLNPDSKSATSLERVMITVERAAELCSELLAYSGRGHFTIVPFSAAKLVTEMQNLLGISTPKGVDIEIETDDTDPTIQGDLTQIRQVVMNLITNAGESITSGNGKIFLTVATVDCNENYFKGKHFIEEVPPGTYASITVQDNGHGMDAATMRKMFDPFFSTKETGHGLGLSAVIGIVRGHNGTIEIDSAPDEGTRATLLLPIAEATELTSTPNVVAVGTPPNLGTILFVDDETDIRDLARVVLEEFGFEVLEAKDGQEAIEVFSEHHQHIQLVMMDLMMPTKSGIDAHRELVAINPDVPVVFSSGFNESEAFSKLPPETQSGFLKKPYLAEDLRQFVKKVIDAALSPTRDDTNGT